MSATIKIIRSDVTNRLLAKVKRMDSVDGFLNRVIYPMYQRAQIERFKTENESEGKVWARLKPTYRRSKLRTYASYPYGGKNIGIATGKLLKSVVGPGSGHRKTVTKNKLRVATTVKYAGHFDAERTISHFSRTTLGEMKKQIVEYLKG